MNRIIIFVVILLGVIIGLSIEFAVEGQQLKKDPTIDASKSTYSLTSLKLRCFFNNADACLDLGNLYSNSKEKNAKEEALDYYNDACKAKSVKACEIIDKHYYSEFLNNKESLANFKDPDFKSLENSCKLKFSNSCNLIAQNIEEKNTQKNHNKLNFSGMEKVLDHYALGCKFENPFSCLNYAKRYSYIYENTENFKVSVAFFRKALKLKSKYFKKLEKDLKKPPFLKDNNYIANLDKEFLSSLKDYTNTIYQKGDYQDWVELENQMCDEFDELTSCEHVAQTYFYGNKEVKKDYDLAFKYYSKLCDYKNLDGCHMVGKMYLKGLGVTQDKLKAISIFNDSCQKKNYPSCETLGLVYYDDSNKTNQAKSPNYLRLACNNNLYKSCSILGKEYFEGKGIAKNLQQSFKYSNISCTNKDYNACFDVARDYEKGYGVKVNLKEALKLYEDSCNNREFNACFNAAKMYYEGKGSTKNYTFAQKYAQISCEKNHGNGCHLLGDIYFNGNGVVANKKIANNLYKKACGFDDKEACKKVIEE